MANRVLPARSTGTDPGPRRRVRALVLAAGAMTAGIVASAGAAEANPGARNGHTRGGDTTGTHHTDPLGYRHVDPNPSRQREHQDARREYRNRQNQARPSGNLGDNGGAEGWSAVPRDDGSGWTVCRSQASWC